MPKQFVLLAVFFFSSMSFSLGQSPKEIDQYDISSRVNVFLGTSGDHGQLSPAASYPFP